MIFCLQLHECRSQWAEIMILRTFGHNLANNDAKIVVEGSLEAY